MSRFHRQRTRWLVFAVSMGLATSACTDPALEEAERACGVFDQMEASAALRVQDVTFSGTDTVTVDPPSWSCTISLPSGSRIVLRLEQGAGVVEAFTRQADTAATVSIDNSVPGLVLRDWTGDGDQLDGYSHLLSAKQAATGSARGCG